MGLDREHSRGRRARVLCVVGTRPEAIKLAPVVHALASSSCLRPLVVKTGQQGAIVDEILADFAIVPELDLGFRPSGQSLEETLLILREGVGRVIRDHHPVLVVAQGDTTSVLAAAWAAHDAHVPLAHVEAGLRSGNLRAPFPEEANRVVVSQLAQLHFAPTARARANLVREGIEPGSIHVTGNTGIDALLAMAASIPDPQADAERLILVTAHRRDSWGAPLEGICQAVRQIHDQFPDVQVIWPVHPNPQVAGPVRARMARLPRLQLLTPLGYRAFVALMKQSTLILTDSGGIQEEAPTLGKPVLVLRDETERIEAVSLGLARVVGRDPSRIVAHASKLLDDPRAYAPMALPLSPYGDGQATARIVSTLEQWLSSRPSMNLESPGLANFQQVAVVSSRAFQDGIMLEDSRLTHS